MLFTLGVHPQTIIRTKGIAQVELTRDKSRDEVEKEALDLATIDALEKAFGRVVVAGNATYIYNQTTGDRTETRSAFNMIANTMVKGEVIEVINQSCDEVKGFKVVEGRRVEITDIKCEILVKAREVISPPVEFQAFPLACLNINCRKTDFNDGDDLYFYFRSPISGYLSIFLDDGKVSHCVFPYRHMPSSFEGGVPIKADQEYYLFADNREYNYFENEDSYNKGSYIDEYKLYTKVIKEVDRIFVIFSRNALNKPDLQFGLNENDLTRVERSAGYSMPKSLKSEDFQRWLLRNRSYLKDKMQMDIIDITVTRQ